MTTTDRPIIDWLLDSDPAIRWQVMRDLTDASAATSRSRSTSAKRSARRVDGSRSATCASSAGPVEPRA